MLCILAGMDKKNCYDVVPMVQTADAVEFLQLQSFLVVDILFVQRKQTPHGPGHKSFVFGGRCPFCAVGQVLRCCLFDDSRDPTVQVVVITVVVQRQTPWSRLFV